MHSACLNLRAYYKRNIYAYQLINPIQPQKKYFFHLSKRDYGKGNV